ncbi:MAG: hypothetical protein WA209_05465, partial [Candidatus Acidiferrales bacterium]
MKFTRPALSLLAVGLLAVLAACGGGGGGSSIPVVSISGSSSTIAPSGTFNLIATVTGDSTNSGVSWTISPESGSGTLSNQSSTAATYTAPSSVPANPSVRITATSVANSLGVGSATFIIQQPAVQVPQYLNGQYAFVMSGFDSSGNPLTLGGSITANGQGAITGGVIDVNDNLTNTTTSTPVTGTYTFDTNGRGTFAFTNALEAFSATPTFAFTMDLTTNSGTIAAVDNSLPAVSGTLDKQTASAFSTTPSGAFILRASSDNPQRAGLAGRLDVVGGGAVSNGIIDVYDVINGSDASDATLTGGFSISDSHGRGTNTTWNIAGLGGGSYVYYAISAAKYYIFENGNSTTGSNTQFVGQMRTQGSLTSGSASGSTIFGVIGGDFINEQQFQGVVASAGAGNIVFSGTSASVNFDLNDAGDVATSFGGSPLTGTVTFDPTTGRGVLTMNGGFSAGFIDSLVFYLESTGKGVMLDTTEAGDGNSYPEALVGDLVPQGSTSGISGTLQGVDLIGDSGTPAVVTAALVDNGGIAGLQSGAIPGTVFATDQALSGTVGAVSVSGRAVVSLDGSTNFFPAQNYPAVVYAVDSTHGYLIQTQGPTGNSSGYSSSLAVYSTQALPA